LLSVCASGTLFGRNLTMAFKLTQHAIQNWGGSAVFQEAEALVNRGGVLKADYSAPWLEGVIARGTSDLRSRAKVSNSGIVENHCPCYASREQGLICSHVVALALTVLRRSTDPLREQKYKEEQRRASRLSEHRDVEYLHCMKEGRPATLALTLPANWVADFRRGEILVGADLLVAGQTWPLDQAPRNIAYSFPPADANLLTVLDDICEGPASGRIKMGPVDFLNVLELRRNGAVRLADGGEITVNATTMRTLVRIDLDRENGELLVNAHTELPFLKAGEFASYVVAGRKGWPLAQGSSGRLRTSCLRRITPSIRCPSSLRGRM